MKHVLIATDGSDHALKAAELGAELAIKMDGAELHILAVAYYEPSEEVELRQVRAKRAPGRRPHERRAGTCARPCGTSAAQGRGEGCQDH